MKGNKLLLVLDLVAFTTLATAISTTTAGLYDVLDLERYWFVPLALSVLCLIVILCSVLINLRYLRQQDTKPKT